MDALVWLTVLSVVPDPVSITVAAGSKFDPCTEMVIVSPTTIEAVSEITTWSITGDADDAVVSTVMT